MQRTKYFNQTRPSEVQLNWTETSRVNSILRRDRAYSQFGIRRGFQVSVNALDSTTIDIAPGEGYTGGQYLVNDFRGEYSGERISTLVDSATGVTYTGVTIEGQSLASYTNGVKNYVSLVYAEEESHALAERSYPYTTHTSVVTETYTVSVLTETDWNALSAENLNKRILVAVVTANGAGVALTSSSIQQFVQPKTHPYISSFGSLTGIESRGLADTMPLGTATLRWDASVQQYYFTAPGDTEGTGVTITNNAVYTLYSSTVEYWIKLWVNQGLVPSSSITQTINIRGLYGRQVPLASATDIALRDMTGSGTVSPTNPLGLSVDDLTGGGLDHQDLFHVNGISEDADSSQLEAYLDAAPGVDRVLITNNGGYDNTFLIDGNTYEVVNGSAAGTPGAVSFDTVPASDSGVYLIYLDNIATPSKIRIGNTLWSANIRIVDMINSLQGTGEITWDATAQTLTWESPSDVAAGLGAGDPVLVTPTEPTGAYSGYYKLYSANGTDWVIVLISGALGANNSSNVTTSMNSTSYSSESILKIATVTWDEPTETLSLLTDLRSFVTADNKEQVLEEHDSDGFHTKPLKNQLRINVTSNNAVYAHAGTNRAVIAEAAGVYGVHALASETAILASVPEDCGVFAIASRSAVVALGSTLAVKGTVEENTAGYFVADTDYGIIARASHAYAVSAWAPNTALYATANTAYAGSFIAPNNVVSVSAKTAIGVKVTVDDIVAISGSAADSIGVRGDAQNKLGVYGSAPNTAIYGYAATASGVYGYAASSRGVYGFAVVASGAVGYASNTGVYGTAVQDVGVYGACGSNRVIGVYGFAGLGAGATGVYGTAASSVGVQGVVSGGSAGSYGVVGEAGNLAGWFSAKSNWAANNVIGLYGTASNGVDADSAIGIQGWVAGIGATAIYGVAAANDGTAVAGYVPGQSAIAVFGSANNVDGTAGVFINTNGRGVNVTGDSLACFMSADAAAGIGAYGAAPAAGTGVVGIAGAIGGSFEASAAGPNVGTAVSASGASLALELKCPAVGAPSSVAEYMPIKYNGTVYTVELWT